jgi:hypothetical protein
MIIYLYVKMGKGRKEKKEKQFLESGPRGGFSAVPSARARGRAGPGGPRMREWCGRERVHVPVRGRGKQR